MNLAQENARFSLSNLLLDFDTIFGGKQNGLVQMESGNAEEEKLYFQLSKQPIMWGEQECNMV